MIENQIRFEFDQVLETAREHIWVVAQENFKDGVKKLIDEDQTVKIYHEAEIAKKMNEL